MIDPLAAFGLAANIIQFLDLGGRIVQTGYRTYKSVKGASDETLTLESVTNDLVEVTEQLTAPLTTEGVVLSRADANLESLGRQCRDLAKRLLDILKQLHVKSDGRFKGWHALQAAVKEHVTKKGDIQTISGLLSTYRQQISTHLLAIMRNDQSTILKELRNLQRSNSHVQSQDLEELREMKKDLIHSLSEHKSLLDKYRSSTSQEMDMEQHLIHTIVDKMDVMSKKAAVLATELCILDSLYFSQMHVREEAIKKTYSGTFTWIFEDSSTEFKSWLEGESGIFWVRGKAGSGKSTLMKFLNEHEQTPETLQGWAGEKRLVTANFYFWSAGTQMQKSQKGLLQSVLFQLLSQCPDLIPIASERRWNADDTFHRHAEPWSRQELSDALDAVLKKDELPARFCFFIDGLDEYSGDYYDLTKEEQDAHAEADHYELIRDLEKLALNPDVKLVLSSRPWNAFRKAFGDGKRPALILEELTQSDIVRYINGMLEEDPRFVELAKEDDRAGEVVQDIREKAEGVFLWVFLAVRSLLRGLTEDDDLEELRKRVKTLPSDLREFFRRILNSIDKEYQQTTCRLLALATFAAPLPFMAFWYLRLEIDDPDYSLKAKIEPLQSKDLPKLKASATTSVNKWCRDLLEVRTAGDDRSIITFLHRTVKEFLSDTDVKLYIDARVGDNFHEELSMCRVHVAEAKSLDLSPLHSRNDRTWHRFRWEAMQIMEFAKVYEMKHHTSPIAILNELDFVGNRFSGPLWTDKLELHAPPSTWIRISDQGKSNFVSFVVNYSLLHYLSRTLQRNPLAIRKPGRPLLEYVLHPTFPSWSTHGLDKRPIPIDTLNLLLDAGADPNERSNVWGSTTVWQIFLYDCYHGRKEDVWKAAAAMIDHGADIDCMVPIKQSKSSRVPIANLSGRREARMDIVGGEMVTKEYATVLECLSQAIGEEEADKLLSEARDSGVITEKELTTSTQSWTSWLLPWRTG